MPQKQQQVAVVVVVVAAAAAAAVAVVAVVVGVEVPAAAAAAALVGELAWRRQIEQTALVAGVAGGCQRLALVGALGVAARTVAGGNLACTAES